MKARLISVFGLVTCMTLLLALLPGGIASAAAQGPEPPRSEKSLTGPPFRAGPYQTPEGLWTMPEGAQSSLQATGISPEATGGPDDYGYTWDDSVAFNWIDASGGTDTGINSSVNYAWPINIGFSFKYYENTYTQLYISRFGFVAFNNTSNRSQSEIPSPGMPNDVIAPHWVPAYGVNGYVRYLQGGIAPNRWFAVEWNRLESDCCGDEIPDEYTFELILHENGDVIFQYGTMTASGSRYCEASGIEDSTGLDGLSITDFCRPIAPNHAVRIYRPVPSARVRIFPLYQGRFTRAGATETFQIPIRNTGELGADTYDLAVSSFWPVALYAADGVTPLGDTDADGAVDTGPVAQGGTAFVTARVQTPGPAGVGAANTAGVTVRSSLNTGKSKTASLQTGVPAPFAQIYRDSANGAMSLYLAQPASQVVRKATSDWYYGYDMATAEAPNGDFVYAWYKGHCVDSNCTMSVGNIEYTLLNKYGETVRGVSRLTNNSGATISTYDVSPAVAVAPNGRIGILWYHYTYQYVNNTPSYNYNIFFAILDAAGNVVYGPANLTNNTAVGYPWSDPDVPSFSSPQIAATGDNRFVLAWNKQQRVSGCSDNDCQLTDIYYAVRDTAGSAVQGITQFTQDTTGSSWNSYYDPNLAALSGNRALLAYYGSGSVNYGVLNSMGGVVRAQTSMGSGGWRPDAAQLSDGRIVVGWSNWAGSKYENHFAVLDGATYNIVAGPSMLVNPAAPTGSSYVSVAADAAGRAILTWMDYDSNNRRNLYYALVDGAGAMLTPPMIFRTSSQLDTSYVGYGNTSYSSLPAGVDGVATFSAALFGAPPGGRAALGLRYVNRGATTATGVMLTATLDANLTYVGDTSGIAPTVNGSNITWSLPNLDLFADGHFTLYVNTPAGANYGTRYPIGLALTSTGPEANPGDNTAAAQVMVARQVYLPLVMRN